MRMYVILAVVVLILAVLVVLLDRVIKAVREGRRRRVAHVRLDAAATRAEEADRRRREAADSSAALTALLPAIKQAKEGPRRVA